MDWEQIVPKSELNYIMGNPPFVGHQWRTEKQQEDLEIAFYDLNKHGKLDYVCGWYNKAVDYISDTNIEVAFVSTNSICQGESVGILWKHLFDKGIFIHFAYRTFIWNSDALDKAHVHCVIVGFSKKNPLKKYLFSQNKREQVKNINGYLIEADNVFIEARGKSINKNVPKMSKGSQPTDGGYLLLSEDEFKTLLQTESKEIVDCIHPFMMGEDFIKGKNRYCFWFKDISPSIFSKSLFVKERLEKIAELRKKSPTKSVQEQADTPYLFTQIRQPNTDYLAIPRVSSERRKYIPMGFLSKNIIAGDKLQYIASDSKWLFGILISSVHNAWMRIVAGRLKSDYSYSPAVYNNFVIPELTDQQKEQISKTAQAILDARALYPDSSLADLYDPLTMPPELLKAHKANDKAVLALYGFKPDATEEEIVSRLMQMYAEKAS